MSASVSNMPRLSLTRRPAFTLIELLVVISIISLLFSILLPSLAAALNSARVAYDLNNQKELARTLTMYGEDQIGDETNLTLPVTQRPAPLDMPWHLGFGAPSNNATYVSEFIYGGFKAPLIDPLFPNLDAYLVPVERRPFNKYIAPGLNSGSNMGAQAGGRIDTYICPSDRSNSTPLVGANLQPVIEEAFSSWQVNGNSFAINWYWFEGPPWNPSGGYPGSAPYGDLPKYTRAGREMLNKKIGRPAAKFVIFYENMMNSYMYAARPQGHSVNSPFQKLGWGWHRKFSHYAMSMLDGHAVYKFVDTRYTNDAERDTWAEPGTPKGY